MIVGACLEALCLCSPRCKTCQQSFVAKEGDECKDCIEDKYEQCECCGQWDTLLPMFTKSVPRWVVFTKQHCINCMEYHEVNDELHCSSCYRDYSKIKEYKLCKECTKDHVPLCKDCHQTADVWFGQSCVNCALGNGFIPTNSLRIRSCTRCGYAKILNANNVCETCFIIEAAHTLREEIDICQSCLTKLTYTDQRYCTSCLEKSKRCSDCGDLFLAKGSETLCSKHTKRCKKCGQGFRTANNVHVCNSCETAVSRGACYICNSIDSLKDIEGKCRDGCNNAAYSHCEYCGDIFETLEEDSKTQCENCYIRYLHDIYCALQR